ncbi:hypothetical protein LR48_Vigan02g130800 [Vigna angularis]|uniref:Uncharacterized protein n=1 Tax=Phaseolus angularis TaxID=3914 RepID=A0A0L9TX41_PHAAN|nr:hypothetical protein LR48_Vigan02g130800 [Vigna angularis]
MKRKKGQKGTVSLLLSSKSPYNQNHQRHYSASSPFPVRTGAAHSDFLPLLHSSSLPYQLTAPALALLLVFRTEASYARFVEGKKAWTNVIEFNLSNRFAWRNFSIRTCRMEK